MVDTVWLLERVCVFYSAYTHAIFDWLDVSLTNCKCYHYSEHDADSEHIWNAHCHANPFLHGDWHPKPYAVTDPFADAEPDAKSHANTEYDWDPVPLTVSDGQCNTDTQSDRNSISEWHTDTLTNTICNPDANTECN